MKKSTKIAVTILTILTSTQAFSECEQNVDKIESFYINGMFTPYDAYQSNKNALKQFITAYLVQEGFNAEVGGQYNEDEDKFSQVIEVARQKWEDDDAEEIIIDFLNNATSYDDPEVAKVALTEFLQDINTAYESTLDEVDSERATAKLESLLDTCSRVVLVTHSQGNFYGNAIINNIYSNYTFPNGYSLNEYPMLGNMQIATPVDVPGSSIGIIYPEVIGNITNNNDFIMELVRSVFGSAEANYNSADNPYDSTGHSLELSYLTPTGQAGEISSQMRNIAYNLTPYPMQAQWETSSSAISGFGHSTINRLLDVEFTDGTVYRYNSVTPNIFTGLLNARSQGGYFNTNIRNNYQADQIE